MSLTKLSLGWKFNYSRPGRVWSVTSWLGTGKRLSLIYSAGRTEWALSRNNFFFSFKVLWHSLYEHSLYVTKFLNTRSSMIKRSQWSYYTLDHNLKLYLLTFEGRRLSEFYFHCIDVRKINNNIDMIYKMFNMKTLRIVVTCDWTKNVIEKYFKFVY